MYLKKILPLPALLFFVVFLSTIPPVHAAEPLWTYSSPGSEIGGVTVSSDGNAIAVGGGKIWLFSRKGTLLAKEPFGEKVIFTPDGSSLLSSYSSSIYLFKRKTSVAGSESPLQKLWETQLPASVRSIDISDDGRTVVTSVDGSGTYIYASTGKIIGGNKSSTALIRVSARAERIVGVSAGVLCLYSRTGVCSKADEGTVRAQPDFMELNTSGSIAVFNDDQNIRSIFLDNKTLRWTKRATGDVTALAMSPSGSAILVGTLNGDADLFDTNGNLSWSYAFNPKNKPAAGITCVALSNDASIAAVGSYDGKIISLNSEGEVIWSNQTKDTIRHIAMSADGSLVVATGQNTVYAFSQSAQPKPTVRTTKNSSTPVPSQSVTTGPSTSSTQKPVTSEPVSREITAVPTEYSVIRTSTQSPLSGLIPLVGIVVALFIVMRKR